MENIYRVGEYLIDFTSIYQITEISGEGDRLIHYKPVIGTDKVFTATVPEKNLEKCGLRRLLTAQEVTELMGKLKEPAKEFDYDARLTKEEIYQNVPSQNIPSLKHLWKEGENIPKSDQDLRDEIIAHLAMEIAFVSQRPEPAVRKEIEKNLNK